MLIIESSQRHGFLIKNAILQHEEFAQLRDASCVHVVYIVVAKDSCVQWMKIAHARRSLLVVSAGQTGVRF